MRSRNANPLGRHRPLPSLGAILIRFISVLVLLLASACVPYPFRTAQLDAPPTHEQVAELQEAAASDSGTVVLRDGGRRVGRWAILDSGIEFDDGADFVPFRDAAEISLPESTGRRVWRGALTGSVLAGAVTAASSVFGGDYETTADVAFPTGLALGVLYGLVVPSQRTFYFGDASRVDVLVPNGTGSGLVLLRIYP